MTPREPPREPDPEAQQCARCSQIPVQCWECQCGKRTSGNLPNEIKGLIPVGGPINPMAQRGSALMTCPDCGAYYQQELDYEFLIPASEEVTTYTRLTREDGKAWEKRILEALRARPAQRS